MTSLENLAQFRNRSYLILGNGRDALFDLMDALLSTRSVSSFVELSLSQVFRREWPSIYEALQDGRISRQALMQEYARHMPASEVVVLCGDHTGWSRPYAKTLQERTYEHQPSVMSGAKPITVGQGYSTIAWVPEAQGSWAIPLLHERITSFDTPIGKAATQLRQVCAQLPAQVLFLADGEYGSAPFLKQTADIPCQKLLRLRPNRVLYHAPAPYQGKGRPYKHGATFSLKAPETWTVASEEVTTQDPKLGRVKVRRWQTLHLRQAPEHPFDLILVECLDKPTSKPFWLIWMGQAQTVLGQIWQKYLRRFAIEHWYRFVRQRLHWTLPQLSTPKQAENWSDLMPLLTWQLWLARYVVLDSPLPWQKPMTQLTPGRIANAFAPLLARIGSPAPHHFTHNEIVTNLCSIKASLRSKGYRLYSSDVRVWIPKYRKFTYPDVMVIQGEPIPYENRTDTLVNPRLILEVLSKSTEDYDQGDKFKFKFYRSIPDLQEYVLVNQYELEIQHYTRTDNNFWMYRTYEAMNDVIALTSTDTEIKVADIYAGCSFEATPLAENLKEN